MDAARISNRYFECVRARDIDGFMDLCSDRTVFVFPDGAIHRGLAAIRALMLDIWAKNGPVPSPVHTTSTESFSAVEVETRLPDGSSYQTANLYYLDDQRRIERLSIYIRGGMG